MQGFSVFLFVCFALMFSVCKAQSGFDLQPTNFYIEDFDTEMVVYQVSFFTNNTQDSVEIAWKRELMKDFPEEWAFTMEVGDIFYQDSVPESGTYILQKDEDLDHAPIFIAQVYPNNTPGIANFSFKVWDVNAPADTITISYTVFIKSSHTYVEDQKELAECIIYPNPLIGNHLVLNDSFSQNISSLENEVKLFDLRGNVVYQEKNANVLNLIDITNGSYFLSIKTNDKQCVNKLQIMR